ncbi:amidohydrolase [Pseudoalteromonas sp. MEBiC 03607]|jgi:imidazolonepropionase-like amidohydrolase|uniref:amidohydrolase family protein n=1 Tax=Pseudoalteromonas TaxID=53246 RepID=UPI000C62CA60|nr:MULTISPECIES: amidohydrolase family protein [unclassified Pseudoalteromonas]MBU77268.1 amidohydrolase [Pseudoalteromonadaceae bacterium]HCV02191.1 amidohydrolase [Pseudoalteromonas sp.]MCF2899603.1 amidohydrolase family protein [Pseudoalteromonas sp. OFAV1]MCF2921397.1 amidohydrolase family protein [Pseudoalteromonas sp. APAL1]MCO7249801.1 amidohydrolase family protein [Pseudoalteromonas sp. Ps84H-4]
MTKLTQSLKLSLVAASLVSATASAASVAIVNATLHTSTEQGVLEGASVVIDEGKIVAINPASIDADTTIDAKGQIVTAGFIGTMNQLGLVEVGAVAGSRDGGDDKAGIDFDPSLAFNPRSSLIPYARKGGITQDLIVPNGGESIFAGLASVVDLSGSFDSVNKKQVALVVHLGEKSKGSRAMSMKTLIDKLEGQKSAKKDDKKDDKKEPSTEQKVLDAVLAGEMPLIASVQRASDIYELVKLKQSYGINLVIHGGDDAVVVADTLAKANVPVIISSMANLPGSFDSLHANLANAGKLEKAGVKVIIGVAGDSSHNVYQLRFDAGNAVSYGMSQQGALSAVTSNIADVFGLNSGAIATGKRANLVMWSADPFELNSHVSKMWINGEEVSTEARQDKLRERYTTDSAMPRAYTK